jgi:transposase
MVLCGMKTPRVPVTVSDEHRHVLERLVRGRNCPQKVVLHARIVLGIADGLSKRALAQALAISRPTIDLWLARFAAQGPDGLLHDAPRPGGRQPLDAEKEAEVLEWTLHRTPPGQTHWSSRTLARALGIGSTTVLNIWHKHGLKPYRTATFKLSNDPKFVEKVRDVVGLYLCPPDKALVLSVDEKSQIQALDRTQPGLPLKKGRCGTMTHDYKRHGTTTLFAALNVLDGCVIGQCLPRHRQAEFLRFLRTIDRETPKDLALHLILDNYGTHKTATVQQWVAKHPRFHCHFIPTSSSWLNLVERFFGELTRKALRRGVFGSVHALEQAITAFLTAHNEAPQVFVWKKDADTILAKVTRARQALCKEPSCAVH